MNDCFVELIKYLKQNDFEKLLYKKIPHIYSEHLSEEDIYSLWLNNAKIMKIEPSTTINLKNLIKMPKGRKAQISRAKREGVVIEESIDFDNFNVDFVRIDILDENIDEINNIINTVKNGKRFEGKDFTNGNLRREI